MSRQAMAQLIVCFDSTTKQTLPLLPGLNTIGRLPQHNNLAIKHRQISTNHAQLYLSETKIILTDKGSKNGTFLLETRQKLQKGKEIQIQQGEQFLFGTIVCQVRKKQNDKQLKNNLQKSQDYDVFGINQKVKNDSNKDSYYQKELDEIIVKNVKISKQTTIFEKQQKQLKILAKTNNLNINAKPIKSESLSQKNQQQIVEKSNLQKQKPIVHNKSKDGKNLLKNKKPQTKQVSQDKQQQIAIDKLKEKIKAQNNKNNKKKEQKSQKEQKNNSLQVRNKQKLNNNKSTQDQKKKEIKNKKQTKKQKQIKQTDNENVDSQNIKKVKQSRKRVPKITQQSESKTRSKQKPLHSKKKQQKKQKSSKMIIQKQKSQRKKSPKRSKSAISQNPKKKAQKPQNITQKGQKQKISQKPIKSLKIRSEKISFVPITRFMVSGPPITFSLNPRLQCVKDQSQEYDVLVMESYSRTYKLLYSIAKGIPIVNSRWLRDLSHSNLRQTIYKFWLKANNTNIIKQSVEKVNQGLKIFNGHKFIIAMDKVHLGKEKLIELIQLAGGQVVQSIQASKKSLGKIKDVVVLLDEGYSPKDLKFAKTINQEKIYLVELVLDGILTQEPDWKEHQIK